MAGSSKVIRAKSLTSASVRLAPWHPKKKTPTQCVTLPKTNVFAPENRPGPKRKRESIPTIHFQVRKLLVSGRVMIWFLHRQTNLPIHLDVFLPHLENQVPWEPGRVSWANGNSIRDYERTTGSVNILHRVISKQWWKMMSLGSLKGTI